MKNITEQYLKVFEDCMYYNVEINKHIDLGTMLYQRMDNQEIKGMSENTEEIAKLCSRIRNGEIRIIEMPKNDN